MLLVFWQACWQAYASGRMLLVLNQTSFSHLENIPFLGYMPVIHINLWMLLGPLTLILSIHIVCLLVCSVNYQICIYLLITIDYLYTFTRQLSILGYPKLWLTNGEKKMKKKRKKVRYCLHTNTFDCLTRRTV